MKEEKQLKDFLRLDLEFSGEAKMKRSLKRLEKQENYEVCAVVRDVIQESQPKRIQRKRSKGWRKPENTISVCRPGKWGNPFKVGKAGPLGRKPLDNEGAVGFFRDMLSDPEMMQITGYPTDFTELAGKNLMCFCSLEQPCHADVLLEMANGENN